MLLTKRQKTVLNNWRLSEPALMQGTLVKKDKLSLGDFLERSLISAAQISEKFIVNPFIIDSSIDSIIHEDDYIKIRWNASEGQMQYFPKNDSPTPWSYRDTSIFVMAGGNSKNKIALSPAPGNPGEEWFYFTGGATPSNPYSLDGEQGGCAKLTVVDDEDPTKDIPLYAVDFSVGNVGFGGVYGAVKIMKFAGIEKVLAWV